jgi:acyl-[acyl-carrier-protein]-phospholipid O-acyltransferase/long-chain-fatty-acid--[acyl-carrier-protein] ligase
VIFPEGRITVTGALMKVYEVGDGRGQINAPILPVRINGAQYALARVGRSGRLFPRSDHRAAAAQFDVRGTRGRLRRQIASTKLHAVMPR